MGAGYVETKNSAIDKIRQTMYYFIIGIISFVSLVFLPMIGTEIGLGWHVPDTQVGWIVWVVIKLLVAALNVLIFHSFMCQAKLNVKNDPKYEEAVKILELAKIKKYVPRSPHQWNKKQYGTKGVTIFITSAITVVALTQAILLFDWVAMLTYLFTIIMGLVFGVLQMKNAEDYWTTEFWRYAMMIKEQNEAEEREKAIQAENEGLVKMAEEECVEQRDSSLLDNSGINILESSDSINDTGIDKSMILDSNSNTNSILGSTIYTSDRSADSTDVCLESVMEENKEKEE